MLSATKPQLLLTETYRKLQTLSQNYKKVHSARRNMTHKRCKQTNTSTPCFWGQKPKLVLICLMDSATLGSPAHREHRVGASCSCSFHALTLIGLPLQAAHLSLREAQRHRQLRLPAHGDVAIALKLLLQLQPLLVGVHHPVLVLCASFPCWFAQESLILA